MKYNLRYTTKSVMVTKNKKFIRTVDYFNNAGDKIGTVETTYNDDVKNTFKVFDSDGTQLEADVDNGIDGRQFLISKYEFAIAEQNKGIARRIFRSMREQEQIKNIQARFESKDFTFAETDIEFLLTCIS
jgi:hypothetical protein